MLGGLGGILGGAGSLLGALGGNDQKAVSLPSTGYATLDPKIKDYMMETIFPRITAWGETPYQTVPLRRANASDYDPIFGSPSRQWLQQYYDTQALPGIVGKNQGTDDGAAAQAVQDLRNEMLAKDFINQYAGKKGFGGIDAANYSPETLAKMGGIISGANLPSQAMSPEARSQSIAAADPEAFRELMTMFNTPRYVMR